jgi:16S rRNA (uracil1498-N3)-methyltransferase
MPVAEQGSQTIRETASPLFYAYEPRNDFFPVGRGRLSRACNKFQYQHARADWNGLGHNVGMIRRVHLPSLTAGSIALPATEAHHIRDVLRLTVGATIELFDDAGNVATGIIKHVNPANVVVDVETITAAGVKASVLLTVASAVPKGDRADWMIEKLTELGVSRFIPLAAERSVVLPSGKNKIERWERIAIESAKQSRRIGVMAIDALTSLDKAIANAKSGVFLSTANDAVPIAQAAQSAAELTLFIGPEGGWSDAEIARMTSAGLAGARLTSTILRVETAAVVGAGVVMCGGDQ